MPRTLSALIDSEQAAGGQVHALAADAETLGLVLPMFDRVSATTAGPHALISERGGYGPVRLAGQCHTPLRKRIAVRLVSGRGEHLVMTQADPARRRPAALHLFGADGHLRHRTEIAAPEDLLVLAGLCRQLDAAPMHGTPPAFDPAPAQVSIPAIRRAQADWRGMTETAHLDDLLLDGGQSRSACLRHLGTDLARPLRSAHVAPFVRHLASMRVPFRRTVLRPGCLQSHAGVAEMVPTGNSLLLVRSKASLFAVDTEAFAACWLTRWTMEAGRGAVVELYDRNGHCLALLTGKGTRAKDADLWHNLAGMFPEG